MDTLEPPRRGKKQGIPLWSLLAALVVMALVSLAALGTFVYFSKSEKLKLQRQVEELEAQKKRGELDRQKGAEDLRMNLARTRQEEVLAQARNATNALGRLLGTLTQTAADAQGLRSNESGQTVALHPGLVAQARRFYDAELRTLPSSDEVIARLEGARRIELQMVKASGTSYEPETNLTATVQMAVLWAEGQAEKVAHVQTLLTSLVDEAKIKVVTSSTAERGVTLEQAIARLSDAEVVGQQRELVAKTSDAKAQAASTVASAEASRIVEEAKVQAARILEGASAKAAQQKLDETVHAAEARIESSKAQVAVKSAENEALKVKLRQKASEAGVKLKLAPFITPGYLQLPGSLVPDKAPHSLTELKSFGALEPTMEGLQKLVDVAFTKLDKVRPRWHLAKNSNTAWKFHPDELESIKEVQGLLNELGPVLVEMGMLTP